MPVDLSVKRVPDEVAQKLRDRAEKNHRSLQRELDREWRARRREP